LEYVNDKDVLESINASVKTAIEENVERTKDILMSEGQITILPKFEDAAPTTYSYLKLDNDYRENIHHNADRY
jgi:hypothetical protein